MYPAPFPARSTSRFIIKTPLVTEVTSPTGVPDTGSAGRGTGLEGPRLGLPDEEVVLRVRRRTVALAVAPHMRFGSQVTSTGKLMSTPIVAKSQRM